MIIARSMYLVASSSDTMSLQLWALLRLMGPNLRQSLEAMLADNVAFKLVGMVGSLSILPALNSESDGYESLSSSASMAEVYMANNYAGAAAVDATTQETVDALQQNRVEGDSLAVKLVDAVG